MSERDHTSGAGEIPRNDFQVKLGNSTAFVSGLDNLAPYPSMMELVYVGEDLNYPITNADINLGLKKCQNDKFGLAVEGDISFYTGETIGDIPENFMSVVAEGLIKNGSAIEQTKSKLYIGDELFGNGYRIDGLDFIIGQDPYNAGYEPMLKITNYGLFNHFGKRKPSAANRMAHFAEPPSSEVADHEKVAATFLKIFMASMNAAAGIKSTGRRYFRQEEVYIDIIDLGRTYNLNISGLKHLPPPKELGPLATNQANAAADQVPKNQNEDPESEIITAPANVNVIKPMYSLEDIGGIGEVKQVIDEIAFSFMNPKEIEKWGVKKPQGLLLCGDPGTGKTMLAHALAKEIAAELWTVQSPNIMDMWLGSSAKNMQNIFYGIRRHKGNLVVFFDEIDSVIRIVDKPGPGGAGSEINTVAGVFKQELDTLHQHNPNVLIVGATNNIDKIDPSLIRAGRFDYKLYVPMPDEEGRTSIIALTIAKAIQKVEGRNATYQTDLDVPALARQTDGMSGADIAEIFRRISMRKAREEVKLGRAAPISQADITATIKQYRTSG